MKNKKSLKAYNFLISGHVFHPVVKEVSSEQVLVLGKSSSLQPVKAWLLVHKDGEILCGHCTCMAGRGETCSHVAAIAFLIEYGVQVRDKTACTEAVNKWLPTTLKKVPFKKVEEMDFRSPAARLAVLQSDNATCNDQSTTRADKVTSSATRNVRKPTKEAFNSILLVLHSMSPKTTLLSATLDYSDAFIPPAVSDELPKLISSLWDPECVNMPYDDFLVKCKLLLESVIASEDEIKKVEEVTRQQAKSDLWFKFRQGRITASNMKSVCRGNAVKPARSTINSICNAAGRGFQTEDTERGKRWEKTARQVYVMQQKKIHQDLVVKECGLFLHPQHAYIVASPDGIALCSCCDETGSLEIKCPRVENVDSCFQPDGTLIYQYYYQVQTQMFVCDFAFCDFFVYTAPRNLLKRVLPDRKCHQEIIVKCREYFLKVILPEIVAKHFSLSRPPLAPRNVDNTGATTMVCFCQTPRRDPMVTCSGRHCTFREFHCRCVNLTTCPKRKWLCDECRP